jgi:uncharacterized membrane protein HdeD (DUF308 family)
MSDVPAGMLRRNLRHEIEALRGEWIWFLILGAVMIVIGVLAIGTPWIASTAVVLTLGILLIAGGIAQCVGAFWARDWSGFFMQLLVGVLYIVLGLIFLRRPGLTLLTLTSLLALLLMVGGAFKVVAALVYRFPQWGWLALGGVLSFLLGILIWNDMPASALWVIGTFLGIDLIFNGASWIGLGLALKKLFPAPRRAATV